MRMPDTSELLHVWELGSCQSAAARALMLMAATVPDEDSMALARLSIGQRDAMLLDIRDALFGSSIRCVTECAECGESIELDFNIEEVRVPHGDNACAYQLGSDGYDVKFRLPDSNDLLALHSELPTQAERRLLARCVLEATANGEKVNVEQLPEEILSALSQGISEADPQADVLLEVSCPVCSNVMPAPFDIVSHLWAELDAWAKRMLREVHTLAYSYGWSETEILRMSATRRRLYLDLIET